MAEYFLRHFSKPAAAPAPPMSNNDKNDAQQTTGLATAPPLPVPTPPRRTTWFWFGIPFQSQISGDQKDKQGQSLNSQKTSTSPPTKTNSESPDSVSPLSSSGSGMPVPPYPFTAGADARAGSWRIPGIRGHRPSGDHWSSTEVELKGAASGNEKELQPATVTATDASNSPEPQHKSQSESIAGTSSQSHWRDHKPPESESTSVPEPTSCRRMGRPNVYRKDTGTVMSSLSSARHPPSTALPFANDYEAPADSSSSSLLAQGTAPLSSGDNAKSVTVTAAKTRTAALHQHPFRAAGYQSRNAQAQAAQQQTRAKSPMDPAFRFLTPYMIGPNWLARTATTFMVSKSPAKTSILKTCGQLQPAPIHVIFDNLRRVAKIGEGVFGEVYMGHFADGGSAATSTPRVYKVVPIEGDKRVNQEQQKRYGEIEPEIVVSRRLNVLLDENKPNFTEGFAKLCGALICRGAYPRVLTMAWKKYQKEQGSENDLPEFKDSQEYVVLESELYGQDVESYTFANAKQALALLVQVAHTLGVGEAGIKFEHRDMHWGNILVMSTPKSHIRFTLNGETLLVPSVGIKSTIIDFTIASTENDDGCYVFTDLSQDEDQFNGDEDYQFEIYRMMRKELGNDWSRFAPRNNIFWMHYLADKLIKRGHYADRKSATHRKYMTMLRYFKAVIKEYESCAHFALSYPEECFLQIDSVDD